MFESPSAAGTAHDTRSRLLDAAETLFAAQGFDGASLRSLTAAAKANVAAANYHFGSKEGLLRAVLERRLQPLNRERIERIDALEARGAEPTLHELLVALFEPALRLAAEPSGANFLRLLGRIHTEPAPSPATKLFFEQFEEVIARFWPRMRDLLPHLDEIELHWRVHFMIGAMAHTMLGADGLAVLSGGACDPRSGVLPRLVAFCEAGLCAPIPGPHDRHDPSPDRNAP